MHADENRWGSRSDDQKWFPSQRALALCSPFLLSTLFQREGDASVAYWQQTDLKRKNNRGSQILGGNQETMNSKKDRENKCKEVAAVIKR